MDDSELTTRIAELVEEEHRLENSEHSPHDPVVEQRVRELEVALDQAWDLLRQRRARRHAGENPDAAMVRPEGTVEGYEQ